jgi:DNA end-binding protein Ku
MPARSISTATISFGLVTVPVELYSTGESSASISFNMLHKECHTKLKQQYVCPKDNKVVERDDIVKGREFEKGKYVVFSPEELKALDEKSTNSIDITEFVPLAAVDRLYLDRAYYLGPGKGGARAYRLLAEALNKTGRAALGQYAARGRQHLVLIRPRGDVLVMEQLYYSDELRNHMDVPIEEGDVKPQELNLAVQIIQQQVNDEFHPENYHDTVRDRIKAEIEKKVAGQDITAAEPEAPKGTRVLDLMEALKASLAKAPKEEAKSAKAEKAHAEKPKKKKAG